MRIDRRRWFQYFAILAAITAYATIVLGGTVRGMGAGLACPDWPLCHGSVFPDFGRDGVAIEYAHRLVAALTSLFILLTFVLAFLWFRSQTRIVILSFMTLALLVTQVVIGALTITSALDWVVVTVHLALGTATMASALIVAILSLLPPDHRALGSASPA
ncbi:MAG TPA: COX15/CtaA family protein [Thermoplasmata archaeon]|nr:COX15/CtaA family protein [Thermoplasmata archaeon]